MQPRPTVARFRRQISTLRTTGGGVFRADPGVSGTYMISTTWTPNGGNYGHYANPDIDKLYAQAQGVSNPDDRKALYTQIAKILNDELPWIFLYSPNSSYGVSNNVQGFVPSELPRQQTVER